MAKKFPDKIYVVRQEEGTKDEFLSCAETVMELAEKGEVIPMAVYELAGTGKVALSEPTVTIKPLKLVK